MIKKLLLISLFVISLGSLSAQDYWDKLNSPPGGVIVSFTMDNTNTLYAGTNVGGVYRSANEGSSWTQINNGLEHFRIQTVIARGNILYAGTSSGGVYRSANKGDSWTQINNGFASLRINAFAYNENYIFAGTDNGVYRSNTNGDVWSPVNNGLTNTSVNSLAISGGNLFAGTDNGVFISANEGLNWNPVNNGLPVNVITVLNIHDGNVFAGTEGFGVYRSTNNGGDWIQVNNGLANFTILSFVSAPGWIYTGTEGGIFRSANNGGTWVQVNNGLTNLFGNALAVTSSFTLAGTNGGVFRSSNNGDSWAQSNSGIFAVNPLALSVIGDRIYAGTSGGVYYSSNIGENWVQLNTGLTSLLVYSLTNNGTYIFAGTNGGVYRLSIGGSTWTQVNNGLSDLFGNAILAYNNYVFVGTNGGVFRSSNNGNNWTLLNNGLSSSVIELAANNNYIYAGTSQFGVYRSPVSGNNWVQINNGFTNPRARALTVHDNFVFAGSNTGVYRSSDNGNNWAEANNGLTSPLVTALESGINLVFAATDGGGVHQSTNNGSLWQPVNTGLLTSRITTINVGGNGYMYAVTYDPSVMNGNGIYRSRNIVNKQIVVQNPASGVEWLAGTQQTVAWSSINVTENVNIRLSTDGGSTYPILLRSATPNDGFESITIPDNPSANCVIKVESVDDNNVFGRSPGTFSIIAPPSITVTAPGAGVEWIVAETENVTWTSENLTGNVNIRLSTDGGSTFSVTLKANTLNDGTESVVVPDNVSNSCIIKVESASDNSIFDVSGTFSINPRPSISVTSPVDSDEWIVDTQENVEWSSQNVTGTVNIKISTDGGNTFPITLKSGTANDGAEVVDVPDNPSVTCVIRVESASDNTTFGVSPGNFSILLPSIAVISPGNGDNWDVGSEQTITWSSSHITGNVNIKLSTDGGTTFPVTLKSNIANDLSEVISVPENPSLNCVVKVESRSNNNIFGLSQGTFSITLVPVIVVLSPSAAANWTIGSRQTVTWSSVNVTGDVNIKLSTDGGSTFPVTLKSGTPNDSTELIDVPANPSETCVIKVESAVDNNIFGVSEGSFTITSAPTITVTQPDASVNWIIGTQQVVSWTSVNVPGNVNIKLSTDGGNTFSVTLKANTPNDDRDTIVVPDNSSDSCRIKVESVDDNNIFGLNPGAFSISLEPSITVTDPNAASNWTIGSQQTVTWTSINIAGNVNILLSTDGGSTFPVALKFNTSNDGSEVVDVPDNPSTSCVIKIESADDTTLFGLSEGNFTITSQPVIIVTAPPASVSWTIGSQQTVTWNSTSVSGNVNIKLSLDGGASFTIELRMNTPNDGSESVEVPDNPSTACRIKIESVNDNSVFGLNPGNFTITSEPTITVTSPTETVKWTIGSQQTVTWAAVNVTGNVNIKLSTDGGNTYPVDLKLNTPNDGSELIDVPDYQSEECRIKVESVDNNSIFGVNSGNFTITSEPTIVVTAPAAAENWIVGSQQTVSWTSSNISGNVNIRLSTDGGNTYAIDLKLNIPDDGTELIDVPDNESAACRIKVESVDNTDIFGINPGDFTITSEPVPNIVVIAPAASITWATGSSQTVNWSSSNLTGNINIKLSLDGGTTFPTTLISDIQNDGTESVNVPSSVSTTCRIKVESVNDNSIFGINPGNFVISSAAALTITSPAAQDVWLVGSQKTITWSSINIIGNVNIKLSTDGGTTFPVSLKSDAANDNSETITVPDNPSDNCRVLVESAADNNIKDMNDDNFSIITYPAVITVNNTTSFTNTTDTRNYKIVGIPGSNSIAVTMSGQYEYDWQVYWDNGNDQNYLVGGSNYTFSPGKAYWVLSKNPLVINQQVNTVPINLADNSFSIPLHSGWNLISNPFDRSVSWAAVRALNSLGENQKIYSWSGGWDSLKTQMVPYEGYYFNNITGKDSLKIPYQPNAGISKSLSEYPDKISEFLKLSVKVKDRTETSEVFLGIDPSAKNEYDEHDYFVPPGDFLISSVSFLRKELPERSQRFFIEQRPSIEEGQIYELEVKTIPNELTEIKLSGIEHFRNYEIYLQDERLNNFYNLKDKQNIKLRLAHQYNNFKLLIGTKEYIDNTIMNSSPLSYYLFQNYPNPFNPNTTIRFSLPEQDYVNIFVYNIIGEIVNIPVNNQLYEPGNYELQFSGKELSSGIYILEMQASKFKMQRKILLLK